MKAYAIFDGGGVLGAALAGCLAATEEQDLEFVGYGGTSAGSVVALLASVGYRGRDLERIMVDTDFTTFLGQRGARVEQFKARVGGIASDLASGRLVRVNLALYRLRSLIGDLNRHLGIDDGEALKLFLLRKIGERHPALRDYADVTFQDLSDANCRLLKVVASDVTRRRPVVFSRAYTGYGDSVLDAVRASTCYPFVFQPLNRHGRRLVDGGLASNLPAFLFHDEYRMTGFPVFAFDLTAEEGEPPANYDLKGFVRDIVSTALDAGDELMRDVLKDVIHVPVPIPARFDVLDFRITKARRGELFNIGYRETAKRLERLEFLKIIKSAAGDLQRRLQAQYGNPMLYEAVLAGLAREVETSTSARNVRATVMLPTGRGTRIVVYSYGMKKERKDGGLEFSTDCDLELPEGAGCSGKAWTERAPIAADLEQASREPAAWSMTHEQHTKVPKNLKAMLSVPIRSDADEEIDDQDLPVVGTLSVDTSTPLADTSWMDGERVRAEVVTRIMLWENVVRRLLRKRHP